ncbi:RNA polymerase sigma-70 factor (ECF subfamily) [Anaerotaenia torta]|uniref:RNA polymerase sigma factor n=1 Tax=Anaerotaenia torta TaxID=433293 RepID=UPI003D1F1C26
MLAFYLTRLDDDDRTFILRLYKNYYNMARKNIYKITHSNNDIEDLIDEVFIKLIEKTSLLRTFDEGRITAYIFYTIKSVAINYIKHKQVENKYVCYSEAMDTKEDLSYSDAEMNEKLVQQEELKALCNAISQLPQNQKDLLYYKYMLAMSDREIAGIFGISSDSVRQYLTRARRNAKKLMEKEQGTDAGL